MPDRRVALAPQNGVSMDTLVVSLIAQQWSEALIQDANPTGGT